MQMQVDSLEALVGSIPFSCHDHPVPSVFDNLIQLHKMAEFDQ